MGNREAPVANMRFLLAVAVLTVVGAHAASDIVVKVDEEELSPLLRTFCCGSVQQVWSLHLLVCHKCLPTVNNYYCFYHNSCCRYDNCCLWRYDDCCLRRCNNCCPRRCYNCCFRRCNNCCFR